MSQRVKKYKDLLSYLCSCTGSSQKEFIKNSSKDFIRALCEVCLNTLQGRVPLTPAQKKKLARHKTSMRKLVKHKVGVEHKRKLLQKGGFITSLLAPLIGSLLKPLIG